jgi:hypothetical protein
MLKSYFAISYNNNMNMAEEQTCEVGSTLAPFTIGPYNMWLYTFGK